MDCSLPGSSVHGIPQARTLEWVAIPPPGDLPDPGIEPASLMSPASAVGSLPIAPPKVLWGGKVNQIEDDWSIYDGIKCLQHTHNSNIYLGGIGLQLCVSS